MFAPVPRRPSGAPFSRRLRSKLWLILALSIPGSIHFAIAQDPPIQPPARGSAQTGLAADANGASVKAPAEGATGAHAHPEDRILTSRPGTRVLPPASDEEVFHFVIYGDRTGGVPAGLKVLEQAVADTNLLDPDLVMTVGDLIQGYNDTPEWLRQMEEYRDIMERLEMRWFPVAGNHDVYWRGEGAPPAGQHESNYETHFGPLWYAFRHKNAGFVALYSDEGDSETNRKGFSEPALQKMSEEQLAFLDQALAELSDVDHVFVFLHHPRWIGGRYGSSWERVHEKLVAAGNVSAVFAGHIHQMRYDGPRDGIEYYTLATTGGHLSADFPGGGYLHHMNMVSVRRDGIRVSAIPIGAVFDPRDFTPEFVSRLNLARSIRPVQKSPELILQMDGSVGGEVEMWIENPCSEPVAGTVRFDAGGDTANWMAALDHHHFTLNGGETTKIAFSVARDADDPARARSPQVEMQLDYLAEKGRIQLPLSIVPVRMQLGQIPVDFFENRSPQALAIANDQSAVRVDSGDFTLPDGPLTVEVWVRPRELAGFNAIVAKTESSEYALFSDEGVPQFDLFLNGQYVSAKATELLKVGEWTHLAGVYDGSAVRLYVNGHEVDSRPGSGSRGLNDLPLYVGADPDRNGQPYRSFAGDIDELRISKAAIYDSAFTPESSPSPTSDTVLLLHFDRNIGPFVLDHSGSAAKGLLGETSRLIPAER